MSKRNIFIRLSYTDVKASLMENVRVINYNNPIVERLLCADALIEEFATFVTKHGTHSFGVIEMTLIKDANLKPTHVFISGFSRDDQPKSVTLWRTILESVLNAQFRYFWPAFLQKLYKCLLEAASHLGFSEEEVGDTKRLLSCISFRPWIKSLVNGRALRSPSNEDFKVIQGNDELEVSMVGFFSWLFHTQTIAFRWIEEEEKMRHGYFYRYILKQINTIRLRMAKVDPSYDDKAFAKVILVEALTRLGVSVYDTKSIMATLKNRVLLKELYEKQARDSGLPVLKELSDGAKWVYSQV